MPFEMMILPRVVVVLLLALEQSGKIQRQRATKSRTKKRKSPPLLRQTAFP
jgi:hypothetical protein